MPELPEVETIRADLDAELAGRRILGASGTGVRTLRRHQQPTRALDAVVGRDLLGIGRRGKYLLAHVEGDAIVVIHLGMSGQLLLTDAVAPEPRHTHVRLDLAGGRRLRFVDPRTFGEVFVSTGRPGDDPPELAHLGFDPWPSPPAPADLGRLLAPRRTMLKALLLDQGFVAGIGNMYADEILWTARLHHGRPASGLTGAEVVRLREAMVEVLDGAVAHRGSSLADEQYRDLYGRIGTYQRLHRAYGRAGLPCGRCGQLIRRVVAVGRGTYYCTNCQRRRRRPGVRGGGVGGR